MWGDPERALSLDASDALSMILFQVASPAHIPYNDTRFQELISGYNVWVHVEVRDDPEGVLHQACTSMSKHAINSSNLAALAILVCEMLNDLKPTGGKSSLQLTQQPDQVAAFSERISIVGKARAAAGALQLLRIFIHRILVDHGTQPTVLNDIFTYRNRDSSAMDRDTGTELLNTLLLFLTADGLTASIKEIPEVYDTAVLSLELLLVMFSTQLYQPMVSSFQQQSGSEAMIQSNYFLDRVMEHARQIQAERNDHETKEKNLSNSNSNLAGRSSHHAAQQYTTWTPRAIVNACLTWQVQRPKSPDRSIAQYHAELARSVVAAKGERVGPDGMYESNLIVTAAAESKVNRSNENTLGGSQSNMRTSSNSTAHQPSFLLDTTRGVLVKASSIIMLPFRLVSLALGLWGHRQKGYDKSRRSHLSSPFQTSRTKDVIWITESPVADLAGSLVLLLTNTCRAGKSENPKTAPTDEEGNPFRIELSTLSDNRWEQGYDGSALPDLPDPLGHPAQLNESISLLDSFDRDQEQEALPGSMVMRASKHALTMNFETLFLSFGSILHTEVGALQLYTLLQTSKAFSETLAVRSDLDTLVLPLLRTLYFSSQSRHVFAQDFHSKSAVNAKPSQQGSEWSLATNAAGKPGLAGTALSIRNCPFRSQSQLYVIVILLLLFSQDSSFGSDAFRRTIVQSVPWYKERYLKDINLGSIMVLTLLRSLTFNLNRLHDMFLLSNCCAVLMNLSHSVVDLHEYAAMRLASVTASCLKKYAVMAVEESKNGGEDEDTNGSSVVFEMYAEISHTLLRLIKHTLTQKNMDRNLHLVYALVYHQADFKKVFSMKHSPFKKSEINHIHTVIKTSAKIIESQFNARTATKALQVLSDSMHQIKEAAADKKKKTSEKEDFTFTYEEEADPEVFFVPYVWEVIVCAVTASSVEWYKDKIQIFPLLEADEPPPSDLNMVTDTSEAPLQGPPAAPVFAQDVLDVV